VCGGRFLLLPQVLRQGTTTPFFYEKKYRLSIKAGKYYLEFEFKNSRGQGFKGSGAYEAG
jgi:hypothetical protein